MNHTINYYLPKKKLLCNSLYKDRQLNKCFLSVLRVLLLLVKEYLIKTPIPAMGNPLLSYWLEQSRDSQNTLPIAYCSLLPLEEKGKFILLKTPCTLEIALSRSKFLSVLELAFMVPKCRCKCFKE